MNHCTSALLVLTIALAACADDSQEPITDAGTAVSPVVGAADTPAAPEATAEEIVANDYCGINAPAPGGEFERSAPLPVWGYAFNKGDWTVPELVRVRIAPLEGAGGRTFDAVRGPRADVATSFGRPELEGSGFGVEADVAALPPGSYMVSVLQEIDGVTYVCNNPLPIRLR